MAFDIIKALREISDWSGGDLISRLLPYFFFSDLEAMEQSMISDEGESRTIFGVKVSGSAEPPLVMVNFLGRNADRISSLLDLLVKLNTISGLCGDELKRNVIIVATDSAYGLFPLNEINDFVVTNPYLAVVNAPTGGSLILDIPASIVLKVIFKRRGQTIKLPRDAAFLRIFCSAKEQSPLTPVEKITSFLSGWTKKFRFIVPEVRIEEKFFNYPTRVSALAVCDRKTAEALKEESTSVQGGDEPLIEIKMAVPSNIAISDSTDSLSKMGVFIKKLREMLSDLQETKSAQLSLCDFEQDRTGDIFTLVVVFTPKSDIDALKRDFIKILHSLEEKTEVAGFNVINLSFNKGREKSGRKPPFQDPGLAREKFWINLVSLLEYDYGTGNFPAFYGCNRKIILKKTLDRDLRSDIEEITKCYQKLLTL